MIRTGRRRSGEPELLGAADAAYMLGVGQANLRTLRGLPPCYDKVTATTLWRKTDIERFARETGRSPRPSSRKARVQTAIDTAFSPTDAVPDDSD